MAGTKDWLVCTAHRSDGSPCRAPVVRGARVCWSHGGAAGHVREAARLRLERLVEPAIGTLRQTMLRGETDSVRLKAAESILDRAGIVAQQQVEVDNNVTVSVTYEDVVLAKSIIDVPIGSNGHTNGSASGHKKALPEQGDSDVEDDR